MRAHGQTIAICIGMAFFWRHLRSDFFGILSRPEMPDWLLWALSAALPLCVAVGALAASRLVPGHDTGRDAGRFPLSRAALACGAAGSVGTALIRYTPVESAPGITAVFLGMILCAVSFVALTYCWARIALSERGGTVEQAGGLFLSFLIGLAEVPSPQFGTTLSVVSPLVSGGLYVAASSPEGTQGSLSSTGSQAPTRPARGGSSWAPVALFVIFLVVGGVIRGVCHASMDTPSHSPVQQVISTLVAGAILLTLTLARGAHSSRTLGAIWTGLAFLFLIGLLTLSQQSDAAFLIGSETLVSGRVFLSFLFWLTLAGWAHGWQGASRDAAPSPESSGFPPASPRAPLALFGLVFCLTEALSWLLGYLVVPLWASAVGIELSGYVGVLAFVLLALLIAAVLVFATSTEFGSRARDELKSPSSSDAMTVAPDGRAIACAYIAHEKGLTPRETEVFELMSRGHSVERIAEQLVISTTTVQTHVKSVYRKTNLHSKQEVIDAVDAQISRQ